MSEKSKKVQKHLDHPEKDRDITIKESLRNAMSTSEDRMSPNFWFILVIPLISLLLGILLLYFTDTPWQLAPNSIGSSILWGAALGIISYAFAVLVTRLPFASSLRDTCRELLPIFGNFSIPKMIILSLAAGLGEEFLFRGFLQEWLIGNFSVEIGIAVAAVFFGLLHFASVSYFLLTTLLGAAMGLAYHLSGSLLLVITWHACYDFLAIWVMSKNPELLGISTSDN